ncbi:MAG: LysR family transcriptional regulator [Bradyrhizobium sp.]|uniref:LysR family transcriptional regulator n=1 Tax=Bradyrhizobium sp. TaxID=376 RepID=UPI003D150568
MDSRQLRYFASIYEHRSLAGAGDHERVAVSALSHHLSNLEAEFGTALFVRKSRGVVPTAAGDRLYDHAKSILKAIALAEHDVRGASGDVAGDVSVGMAYSCMKAIGVPMLKRIQESYPRLKLTLSESLSGSTLIHLLSSEVELAVVYNPPPNPRLKTEPLLEEQMLCIGKPEIIGASAKPITFAEILELPVIILRQGLSAKALMDNRTLLKKLEAAAQWQMNSVYAITGALLAGLGCIIGTRHFLSDQIEQGQLHARPIVEPELMRTLYICEMADQRTSFALEAVRTLIRDLAVEAVQSGAWPATVLADGDGHAARRTTARRSRGAVKARQLKR